MPDRLIPVQGTLNFRDLGGYPTVDGGRVRWGMVYRSDHLAEVGEEGWATLAGLRIREIFDLRHDAERDRQPSRVPPELPIRTTLLAIGGEAAGVPDVVDLLSAGGEDAFGIDFMIAMYQGLVSDHARTFATLLGHLAQSERLPAVFHCTAGKDRTGVASALLLSVLGVARDVVLDDYELSTRYRSERRIAVLRPRLEAAGVDVERVRPFLSAPRPALEAALAAVDIEHGGVEQFLVEMGGADGGTISALRDVLVES